VGNGVTKAYARQIAAVVAVLATVGCGKPGVDGLRESFAQQVASNQAVRDFHRSGEELLFTGPSRDGGTARWRIHIDSAVVEPNNDPAQPYKGTVKSSWYGNDEAVRPTGQLSNLPVELLSNGVSQDCWAFWNASAKKWTWE
jgi:hypothetical protein